jgi:hypothetical protein
MAYIIAGLMKDAHQARGVVRALSDAGFEGEEIDMSGGPISGLTALGVPEGDAHVFAEGVRRGGAIVAVSAHDEMEAEQAALVMNRHGAVDIEACANGWRIAGWNGRIAEPATDVYIEHYAYVFGDYPDGAGQIYRDPRTRPSPSVRTPGAVPGGPYHGPERRRMDKPYAGVNRRAA